MIDASEALRVIGEAEEQLAGPLLDRREENRVIFVGDTHGAVDVTEAVIDKFWDDADLIVFLGDYVDRSDTSLENLGTVAASLLEDPHRTIMLRGNHESPLTNPYYGFTDEVTKKLGEGSYDKFKEFFQKMPYAVVVNDYLCLHGGIAKGLTTVDQIAGLPWPDLNPDDPVAFQLLWNDPREMIEEFVPSTRGEGAFYFGSEATTAFLDGNALKGIIRGHEVVDGFRDDMGGRVITVFSSRYHHKSAGVLILDNGKMERVTV
ncbi:MAG TPA: metallophosphoesterase [Candidatus Bathyarchaeia archaeon]